MFFATTERQKWCNRRNNRKKMFPKPWPCNVFHSALIGIFRTNQCCGTGSGTTNRTWTSPTTQISKPRDRPNTPTASKREAVSTLSPHLLVHVDYFDQRPLAHQGAHPFHQGRLERKVTPHGFKHQSPPFRRWRRRRCRLLPSRLPRLGDS